MQWGASKKEGKGIIEEGQAHRLLAGAWEKRLNKKEKISSAT